MLLLLDSLNHVSSLLLKLIGLKKDKDEFYFQMACNEALKHFNTPLYRSTVKAVIEELQAIETTI